MSPPTERRLPRLASERLARALPADGAEGAAELRFREESDDFRVEELPLYLPAGEGEHLYLHIEKRNLSTPQLVARLQERFGLEEAEVGYAGRKDARGVTTQWLSVPARKVEPELEAVEALGELRLLEAKRHQNKLRLGHLRGNRFTLHLRGSIDLADVDARAMALCGSGMPNYFGGQRFGAGGYSIDEAERFLARGRRPRGRRERFWASVAQSSFFNDWLSDRVADGSWQEALAGDVLMKPTGASFVCEDPSLDTPRVRALEVTPAGPLYGAKMRTAGGDALTRESRLLEASGWQLDALMRHPALDVGTRRPARVLPEEWSIAAEPHGARLGFTLPRGSYATVLLGELLGARVRDAALLEGADEVAAG